MNVAEAVASRRSIRAFRPDPVELPTLRRVLDRARWAPSGCNLQPWKATVLTGDPLRALQEKMLASERQAPEEYSFSEPKKHREFLARLEDVNASMYGLVGIGRDDPEGRARQSAKNVTSFGAPVLLLCHFERFMGPPQWSDVGMWMQTVMLLLRDEGLDSCAQEWLSFYARLIKDHIGVLDEGEIFFCGLAIGYRDEGAPINAFDRNRISLEEQVTFVGF